ncbi:cell division protein ZapE [Gordonia soli]|uniref:ATPase n=1 Tax=Gordonia soli NBRC 108243 TaxID=1223545 RepID=M0QL09_9ACTN|nr:cell division protein ZapE [Gordonia soli]GAC68107.1 hypothetical protein GS4_11_03790 [Gordonia soli NBRC 108243]
MWPRLRRTQKSVLPSHSDFVVAAASVGFTLDVGQRAAVEVLTTGENVYLHGPPGRGKSWLMDVVATTAPTDSTLRLHSHEFADALHAAIVVNGSLATGLEAMLGTVRTLCFDELVVDDPADGIFLARLFAAAVDRDVTIVITSNSAPDELMPNPLFHDTFVPTIELLRTHCQVVELDGGTDYRSRAEHGAGFASGRWIADTTGRALEAPSPDERTEVRPAGHPITARAATPGRVWFTFDDLCGSPTGVRDYLRLVADHRTWVIDDIPPLGTTDRESARRFAHVVDVLYDRDVPTTFRAAGDRDTCVPADLDLAGVARLRSRLTELRSHQIS